MYLAVVKVVLVRVVADGVSLMLPEEVVTVLLLDTCMIKRGGKTGSVKNY